VAQIVSELEKTDYKKTAKVPLSNLVPSALSKRSNLFFRAKHGVYGLKGKHPEEGG
jgi:hypothetical protein